MTRAGFTLAALSFFATPASAMDCPSTDESHGYAVSGTVAGDATFRQTLVNGWVFALLPARHGWVLRVFDRAPIDAAADVTAFTPPLRGPVNPRDLFGWHFRNAANDGPNTGDVNAPQDLRAFVISPGIAGTAGLRPPDGPVEPSPEDGIGQLRILDKGLADLAPGQRARLNYVKFEACLRWPKDKDTRNAASLDFIDEEIEIFGSCGLDLTRYELHAVIPPRMLGGDFDGDGALDEAAQIRRRSDGVRGLALCRAGTWMQVFGLDAHVGLRRGFIAEMEAWRAVPPDHDGFSGYDGAPPWPGPEGDALALERTEKELYVLYFKDGAWRSQRIYRIVEP